MTARQKRFSSEKLAAGTARSQHVERRAPFRVAGHGKIDERLDRAVAETPQEPGVFLPHRVLGWLPRPAQADAAKVFENDVDGEVGSVERRVERDAKARDGRSIDQVLRSPRQSGQSLFSRGEVADQELAFGPLQLEIEAQAILSCPAFLRHERAAGDEIRQRRRIGGRCLGAFARHEIKAGDLPPLCRRADQGGAPVELVDDLENLLGEFILAQRGDETASDAQMNLGPPLRRNARIGRLADAVMAEGVSSLQSMQETRPRRLPERRMNGLFGRSENQIQRGDLGDVAKTGQQSQRLLRRFRQAAQLRSHEVGDVVGEALGANAIDVPPPDGGIRIECDEALVGQHRDELNQKERIARRLLEQHFGQRLHDFRCPMERVGDQLFHVLRPERRQHDFLDARPRIANLRQRTHERVRRADFVVAIGSDQQDVAHFFIGDEALEQFESGGVEPLQIIEEQSERVLRASEHAEKSPEHHLESILLVVRRKGGDRRLFADDAGKLGNQIDHELGVRAERLQQSVAAAAQFRVVFGKDAADHALKRLRQGRIRDVALVLIELAGREKSARRNQHFVQLVDDGGLAGAGVP